MPDVQVYSSIHDIDATIWDALLNPGDIYNTHQFVSVIEDAGVEQSHFWYLIVSENNEPIATACLSAFNIALDLLLEGDQNWVKLVRKIWPRFLQFKILLCGLPVSLGQKNIAIKSGVDPKKVLDVITQEMMVIAREENIYHLCYKEFSEEEATSFDSLSTMGFFEANSIPYMEMEVRWNTFSEYLTQLRHPYRRKIKKGLGKLNITELHINFNTTIPGFFLNDNDACPPHEFYKHYAALMQRVPTKLETLNARFFDLFYERYANNFDLLGIQNAQEVLAAGILLHRNNTLHFMLIGLPEFKNKRYDPYFNLLYAIIQLAIDRKCDRIQLGQTAYWVKQQIGGTPKNVYLFYHCRRKITHFLLKKAKNILFPKLDITPIFPFKKTTQ